MIQRIQTVYLLLAFAACILCMCMPVGNFVNEAADGMYETGILKNLWVSYSDGHHDLSVWGLFAILVVTSFFSFIGIFQYKRRMMQLRICTLCMLLLTGWYITYAVFTLLVLSDWTFHISWAASLPLVAIILHFMAFQAIRKDEKLVRSLDRLR